MGDITIDNIEISNIPAGPVVTTFNNDSVEISGAIQDQVYTDTIAADAQDRNGDPITFNKISGPAWLNVASDGELSGAPGAGDVGLNSFEVEVSNDVLTSTATLIINVNDSSTPVRFQGVNDSRIRGMREQTFQVLTP